MKCRIWQHSIYIRGAKSGPRDLLSSVGGVGEDKSRLVSAACLNTHGKTQGNQVIVKSENKQDGSYLHSNIHIQDAIVMGHH